VIETSRTFERLEPRRLLAGDAGPVVTLEDNVLRITGTDAADTIDVQEEFVGGHRVTVTISRLYEYEWRKVDEIVIDGLGGDDVITCYPGGFKRLVINGGDGNDTMNVGGARATVTGGAGNDAVVFKSGYVYSNGHLFGSDYVVLNFRAEIDGGDGIDGVTVNKQPEGGVLDLNDFTSVENGAAAHKIIGTDAPNMLTVLPSTLIDWSADPIEPDPLPPGLTGNFYYSPGFFQPRYPSPATVLGGGGDDVISGDAGADSLDGGEGSDRIAAAAGNDRVEAGSGNDTIDGGEGDDKLYGRSGVDRIFGGNGNDRVAGNGGHDKLFGEGNVDRLYGGDGNDLLDAGTSNDRLYGEGGADSLYGNRGNDRLYSDGDATMDHLFGGPGTNLARADLIDALTEADRVT
jgi:Ca2+-binding RTX toxin-like protein